MKCTLLGEHLSHSLSVPIHEEICRETGYDVTYTLTEIPADRFDEIFPHLLKEYDGFNVTIPYKKTVMPYLDGLSESAAGVGAVNTLVKENGKWIGHNTDVAGFKAMLRLVDPGKKCPCYILGTGGASLAVKQGLKEEGFTDIHFVSRDPAKGETMESLAEHFSGLLINCTPVGMYPKTEGCPVPDDILDRVLERAEGVLDLIYNPEETVLLRRAREKGIPTVNGMIMLKEQAVAAEELWHR